MIHPAHAGSEVYASLARRLEGQFSCFGVDSYNLQNTAKIDSLHELAALYLDKIDAVMKAHKERVFRLLGWSLGGHIALEIAAILESRGIRDIEVYLLDTVLPDERLVALSGKMSLEAQKNAYRVHIEPGGIDDSYMATVLSNFGTDAKLSLQTLSRKLTWASILLFKALSRGGIANEMETALYEYVASLEFNNVDQVHQDLTRLRRVVLANAHHFDVLNYEDDLLAAFGTG